MSAENYPLLFTYTDLVAGNGFVAGVLMRGRALMKVEEDGDVWIDGVSPPGIGDGGASLNEASAAFRETYRSVLFDIAADAASFADFASGVEEMVREDASPFLEQWKRGVKLVREGKLILEGLEKGDSDSYAFGVEVAELKEPKASHNRPPQMKAAA